ncbi:MAG: YitT family protein [Chloroflexi bacterium]|nr:YitT family protein [Chloroflexota bacterium]
MSLGAILVAFATRVFLIPNQVVTGGVTGIAIITNTFWQIPIGVIVLAVNVPLLLISMRFLGGWRFALRTLYTTVLMSVALEYSTGILDSVTDDPLLYSLYGGLIAGVGGGLIFRARSTGGGFDIVARLLEQRFGYAPGRSSLILNGIVFAAAMVIYGPEKILYAILVSFVASRALDVVLSFGGGMNQVFIITAQPNEVSTAILQDLNRGATVVSAKGAYTGAERAMLLCVMTKSEVPALTHLVSQADPHAFVVVGEAVEVFGKGFRALPQ